MDKGISSARGLVAAALVALAASAVGAAEAEATADKRIGKEVDRICFARTINGWKTPKGEDGVVLLETGVNTWYRVEVRGGACDERLFRFANEIGIDSSPGGGCVTRGDAILVSDTGDFVRRCYITQINEWDDDAPAPGEEEASAEAREESEDSPPED